MEDEFNYKYALERLKYENSVFWQRTTAFLISNSLLILAFSYIDKSPAQVILVILGIFLAISYGYACYCSKLANDYWQNKTKKEENELIKQGKIKEKMWTDWEKHFYIKLMKIYPIKLRKIYPGLVIGCLLIIGFIAVWITFLFNI